VTRITALVGIITISFSAILVRLADVAPATAGLFRAAYALPVLYVLRRLAGDDRSWPERRIALLAGVLLTADIALWHTAIGLIGAGMATVVVNTQVLWVGAGAWLLHKEKPTGTAFIVVPVVLVGVALIGGIASTDAYGSNPALGALLSVIGGMFYSAFLLLFRHANAGRGPTSGPMYDATLVIAVLFLVGGWLDPGFAVAPSWPAHGWLIALGVLIHTGGWLLIATALPRLPALDTSVMLLLQPALTLVWAMIIFSERLAVAQLVGVLLVLVGIGAAAIRGVVRPAAADTRPDS
jgi:drug/metabolite transporter (DMT)-like permease